MKTHTLATILLKALGVYLFLQFLAFIPAWLSLIQMALQFQAEQQEDTKSILTFWGIGITLLTSIIYLCLSWFLLFRTKSLFRFFVQELPEEGDLSLAESESFQNLAFQCLGLYAIVSWAPPFGQRLVYALIHTLWPKYQTPFPMRFSQNWLPLIAPLLGLAIGLALLFNGRALIRLLKRTARPAPNQEFNQ